MASDEFHWMIVCAHMHVHLSRVRMCTCVCVEEEDTYTCACMYSCVHVCLWECQALSPMVTSFRKRHQLGGQMGKAGVCWDGRSQHTAGHPSLGEGNGENWCLTSSLWGVTLCVVPLDKRGKSTRPQSQVPRVLGGVGPILFLQRLLWQPQSHTVLLTHQDH